MGHLVAVRLWWVVALATHAGTDLGGVGRRTAGGEQAAGARRKSTSCGSSAIRRATNWACKRPLSVLRAMPPERKGCRRRPDWGSARWRKGVLRGAQQAIPGLRRCLVRIGRTRGNPRAQGGQAGGAPRLISSERNEGLAGIGAPTRSTLITVARIWSMPTCRPTILPNRWRTGRKHDDDSAADDGGGHGAASGGRLRRPNRAMPSC